MCSSDLNGSAVTGSISPAGDADWFSFAAAAAGVYTITTQAGTLTADVLALYGPDSQTALVQSSNTGGPGNMAQISCTLAAGTYYVRVVALSSSATGSYNIRVATGSPAPVVNSFAVNSGAASTTSQDVTLNSSCAGSPTAYLASENPGFTNAAWLAYAGAAPFTLSAGSGTKTVYFKVRNAFGTESGVRSDTISYSGPPSVTLAVNSSAYLGNIATAGEADWYAFKATASGTYTITTQAGTLTDNIMNLYGPDSQTTLVESDDDDGTGNMALISRTLSPGKYYVKVFAKVVTDTGTYTIRVSR